MRALCLTIFFLVSIFGCSNDPYEEKSENLTRLVKAVDKGTDRIGSKTYFVVPLQGCSPCIDKMLRFAIENSQNEKIKIIISGNGKKDIKLQLESRSFELKNFYVDDTGYAKRLDIISGYPMIYYCKEDKVVKLKVVSPENFSEELFLDSE